MSPQHWVSLTVDLAPPTVLVSAYPLGVLLGLDASTWATISVAVVGTFLALIGSLVAIIFAGLREDIKTNTLAIERNARHVDSIMATTWSLIWRLSSLEDFLEEQLGYRPPKIMPRPPPDDDSIEVMPP